MRSLTQRRKTAFISFSALRKAAVIATPVLLAATLSLSDLSAAHAQNQFFAGDGSALTASKWSVATASTTSPGGYTNAFVSGNNAYFTVANGTGTGGSITFGGIVATQNFTLTSVSGTISNKSNGVIPITVASGFTLDFSSQTFTGSATAGYTFGTVGTAGGVLALAGNTYGGGFTLNSGTVIARGVNALGGGTTNTLTINGGTLAGSATRDFSGKYTGGITIGGDFTLGGTTGLALSTANLTFSNNVALGSAVRTITLAGTGTNTFTGIVSGTGGLAVAAGSTGVLSLGGANTYSGGTTINAASVIVTGTSSLGTGAVTNNAALTFTLGAASTYSNAIGGSGTLTTNGSALTLSGANTYTGATTIAGGSSLTVSGSLSSSTAVTIGSTNSAPSSFNLTSGATQTVNGFTLVGGQSLISASSGTLGMGAITHNINATVDLSGSVTTTTSNVNGIIGGYATLSGTNFAVSNGGSSLVTGAALSANDFTATTNNVDVTMADTLSGNTTVNTLRFATGPSSVDTGGNTLTLADGGILETTVVGANAASINNGMLTTTNLSGTVDELYVHQNNTSATLTIGSTIVDNGATKVDLIKDGAGSLTLTGANTFSGTTYVHGGSLVVANTNALGSSTVVPTTGGGTIAFGTGITSPTFGGLSGSGNIALTNADSNAVNLSVGANNTSTTYSGTFSGLGSVTKTGTGQLNISGSDGAFTGGFIVNQGTLQVLSTAAAIGASTNSLQINGGQVYLGGYSPTIGSLSGTGGTLSASSGAFTSTLTVGQTTNTEFDGTITNGATGATFKLTKTGTGALTLTGANTYTGATTISAGTIIARNTGVSNASAVSVASGATLGVGEVLNTVGSPQATGTLTALSLAVTSTSPNAAPALTFNLGASNTSDTLTLTGTGTPLTFSGTGSFNIGFADATGAGLGAGTYTLLALSSEESTSSLPAISKYNAVPSGNLASISGGSFAYTIDSGTGNVTALTFTIGSGTDAMPEPSGLGLLAGGLPVLGIALDRLRRKRGKVVSSLTV